MPIEIRELVIKATIGEEEDSVKTSSNDTDQDKDQQLIQACVESVLEVLRENNER